MRPCSRYLGQIARAIANFAAMAAILPCEALIRRDQGPRTGTDRNANPVPFFRDFCWMAREFNHSTATKLPDS